MTERTLTALYDTQGAAAQARDDLIALGIPSGQVTLRGNDDAGAAGTGADEDRGFWGDLKDAFLPDEDRHAYAEGVRRGGYLLAARVPDDLVERAHDVVERAGPADLDERSEAWRRDGWSGAGVTRTTTTTATEDLATAGQGRAEDAGSLGAAATGGETVQLAEERLRVGKREVGRGAVRARSYVVERPVEEQVTLRDERVEVERRSVDRPIKPGDAAFQEKVIEATERREEAVVSKEARVVEEIALRKVGGARTETVRDTVREQKVEIVDERSDHDSTRTDADRVAATTTTERTRR